MSDFPTGTFPVVFETGVVRFDEDGRLHVHLSHSPATPHPMVVQGLEGEHTIPGELKSGTLRGREGPNEWRTRAALREAESLPEGFVFTFANWELAQVEMSGDLSVLVHGVDAPPPFFHPGYVHRFAGPDDAVRLWVGSEKPPERKQAAPPPPPRPAGPGPAPKASPKAGCALLALLVCAALVAIV